MNENVRVASLLRQARDVVKDEKSFVKLDFHKQRYTNRTDDNNIELAHYIAAFVKELVHPTRIKDI